MLTNISSFFHRIQPIIEEHHRSITYKMDEGTIARIARMTWLNVKNKITSDKEKKQDSKMHQNREEEEEIQMTDDDAEEEMEMTENSDWQLKWKLHTHEK